MKQSVFSPSVIEALTQLPETTRQPREDVGAVDTSCCFEAILFYFIFFSLLFVLIILQTPDGDSPFLDIDLEWDLPDFATVGMEVFLKVY